jgi:hypothetical protein
MSRSYRERLLLGLGNTVSGEPFNARALVFHCDRRGVVRGADGPVISDAHQLVCRTWRGGYACGARDLSEGCRGLEPAGLSELCVQRLCKLGGTLCRMSAATTEPHCLPGATPGRPLEETPLRESIHQWLNRHHPRSGVCEECGAIGHGAYASLTEHSYTRDRDDYAELCARCQRALDNGELVVVGLRTRG